MYEIFNDFLQTFNKMQIFLAMATVCTLASALIGVLSYLNRRTNLKLGSVGRSRDQLALENTSLSQILAKQAGNIHSLEKTIGQKEEELRRYFDVFPNTEIGCHILLHELSHLSSVSGAIKRSAHDDLKDHLPEYAGRPMVAQFAARVTVLLAQNDLISGSHYTCTDRIVAMEMLNDCIFHFITLASPKNIALYSGHKSESEVAHDIETNNVLLESSTLRGDDGTTDILLAANTIVAYLSSTPVPNDARASLQKAIIDKLAIEVGHDIVTENAEQRADRFRRFPNTSFLLAWVILKSGVSAGVSNIDSAIISVLDEAERFHPELRLLMNASFPPTDKQRSEHLDN